MKRSLANLLPAVVIATLVVVLFRKVVRLWWMYDDPFQVRMLRDVGIGSLLTSKAFYGGSSVFTPWLILSLKFDHLLFGENALPFYAHQLIALTAALLVEYWLLRLWCAPLPSLAKVIVTTSGLPLIHVVPLLMCRHYIEGSLFAFGAAIAYVYALRGRRTEWLSAAAYFLAACAKEIFVPLPLLLLAIPESSPKARLHALRGHAIAAVAYAAWRLAAVGVELGSYGVLGNPGERRKLIAMLPWTITRQLAGSGEVTAWALVIAVAACVVALLVWRPSARIPVVVAFLLSFLPLIPLAAAIERRYALALWICAAMAVAFLPRVTERYGAAIAVAVAVISLLAFRIEWPLAYRGFLRMSDETRILSMLGPRDIILNPITPPTTMLEVARLTGTEGHAWYDERALCAPGEASGRIFEYDQARRELRETTRAALDRVCRSIVDKPIRVEIRFDRDGAFYWSLGPYPNGRWTFIIAEGLVAYDVAPKGGFRRPGWDRFQVRARYIAPEGWRTYSPLVMVDRRIPLTVYQR